MSWKSGSSLMSSIIHKMKDTELDDELRKEVYIILIEEFEDYDCDSLYECVDEDEAFKAAFNDLHPGVYDHEEDDWE